MLVVLTTVAQNKGWRYKFSDGEKAIVNFDNVSEVREVDLEIRTFPNDPEDSSSGNPERESVRALAVTFNSRDADGDALIFYYRETLKDFAKKIEKAGTTYTEFVYG
jgi:hypothetical protein